MPYVHTHRTDTLSFSSLTLAVCPHHAKQLVWRAEKMVHHLTIATCRSRTGTCSEKCVAGQFPCRVSVECTYTRPGMAHRTQATWWSPLLLGYRLCSVSLRGILEALVTRWRAPPVHNCTCRTVVAPAVRQARSHRHHHKHVSNAWPYDITRQWEIFSSIII